MRGFLIHLGTRVTCSHAGAALATVPNLRVQVSGQATALTVAPYVVSGCPLPPVGPAGIGPCLTGEWLGGTNRVRSNGQSLVLSTSPSICAPSGAPMIVQGPVSRVAAS